MAGVGVPAVIEAKRLTKRYGPLAAVDGTFDALDDDSGQVGWPRMY